ncbi:MAG: peroxide stress protein YaaA [Eudoraea sp.]|nr:peroxide stress protein YaaA [Eudoraea sp.]
MKIVISPAKSLDLERPVPTNIYSQPVLLQEAERLNSVLSKRNPRSLARLMGISESLADVNWQRNQDFQLPLTPDNARPAVFTFNGEVYLGLDPFTLSKDQIDQLQEKLRILSGLYGILKPLDLIQPYRLEMGTTLRYNRYRNLYEFWQKKITKALNEQLEDDEVFINLASNEYFKAIDIKALKVPVITPVFKDWKNGQLKVLSFFAKKARGRMVRYILDHNADTLDTIRNFNYDGYAFSEEQTSDPLSPVFVR